jgi:hypothetical protein
LQSDAALVPKHSNLSLQSDLSLIVDFAPRLGLLSLLCPDVYPTMLIVNARHLSLRKTGLRFREADTRTGLTFLTQGLQRLHLPELSWCSNDVRPPTK